jgi:hypothetical protein
MKKILLTAACGFLLATPRADAQRLCGAEIVKAAMIAKDPAGKRQAGTTKTFALQSIADQQKLQNIAGTANKTTATNTIPVIFHIIVNSTQFDQLGGYEGIAKRCDSQIAVLNRDFNRQKS